MIECPDPQLLARLLNEPELLSDDILRGHIDACALCQGRLDQLTEGADLRMMDSSIQEPPPATAENGELDRVLVALRALPGMQVTDLMGSELVRAPRSLLGPPLEPGELGTLGPFRVEKELGRGGMGIVYKGFDPGLRRCVALKLLRPELEDARSRALLVREARAAARFRHRNVVTVYGIVDPSDASPYLVMEYLTGSRLGELARASNGLEPRRVATILVQVADTLAAAHAEGLVHQDVKPDNIVIDPETDRPKLMDFGLALTHDSGRLARDACWAGTPAYMSPEQVQGTVALDQRADVYGLGATLYEALTGVPPFRGARHVVLQKILDEEPLAPRRLDDTIPIDLETICLKALSKDPAQRYQSAVDMGDDLRHFLAGEAVAARPAGRRERGITWAKRRPAIAALRAGIVMSTMLGFALVSSQWYRAEREAHRAELRGMEEDQARQKERERAESESNTRREAQRTSARLALARAQALGEQGLNAEAINWLAKGLRDVPDDDRALERALRVNWTYWRPGVVLTRELRHSSNYVDCLAFSPNGKLLLAAEAAGKKARLWDLAEARILYTFQHDPPVPIAAVAFHPHGELVATAYGNGGDEVQLWRVDTGEPVPTRLRHSGPLRSIAFNPDGTHLASIDSSERVRVWDVVTGEVIGKGWTEPGAQKLAYFPDGQSLLIGGFFRTSSRRDALSGQPVGKPFEHAANFVRVATNPDGKTYLTGGEDQRIQLVDATTGEALGRSPIQAGLVRALDFSPDGQHFLVGTTDGVARVWNTVEFRPVLSTSRHFGEVTAVAFAPNGKQFATGSTNEIVRIWTITNPAPTGAPFGPSLDAPVRSLAVSPSGLTVVCQAGWSRLESRNGSNGQPLGKSAEACWWFPPLADGLGMFMVQRNRDTLQRWDAIQNQYVDPKVPYHRDDFFPNHASISADGRRMITLDKLYGKSAQLWNLASGQCMGGPLTHSDTLSLSTFTADSKTILSGGNAYVCVWDAESGRPIGAPIAQAANGVLVASPDGRRFLAAGGQDAQSKVWPAQVWDLARREPVGRSLVHAAMVRAAAFDPEGRTVVTGSQDRTARLWNAETGAPIGPPLLHGGSVESVAFSPDGKTVLTRSLDGKARLWEPISGTLIGEPLVHKGRLLAALFHPDGRSVLTGGEDGLIRKWIVSVPVHGTPDDVDAQTAVLTGMALNAVGQPVSLNAHYVEGVRKRLQSKRWSVSEVP